MILAIIGIVLLAVGAVGIWLSANSPVQLQPLPAIVLVAGIFTLGGAVL